MSAAQQAKAKRRQMTSGYAHLARRQRPISKRKDLAVLARRAARSVETLKRIAAGVKKK